MAAKPAAARVPAGLGVAGKALWRELVAAVVDGFQLDPRELAILARACSCADTIATLEGIVKRDGAMTRGSTGQVVLHPAIAEIRHQKLALLRFVTQIDLGEEAEEESPAKAQARRAAQARWAHRDRVAGVRAGASG